MSNERVIKKRIVLGQADLPPEPEPSASAISGDGPEAAPPAQEIRDQFFRPLSETGGLAALAGLQKARLTPDILRWKSTQQLRIHERQVSEAASLIAEGIYQAAQLDRTTDIDWYLNLFESAIGSFSWSDRYVITQKANELFTTTYDAPIRERGERAEILSQIVRRIGLDHRERVREIAEGFPVHTEAERLRLVFSTHDLRTVPETPPKAVLEERLLRCTPSQVEALRGRYAALPYESLARALSAILDDIEKQKLKAGEEFFEWIKSTEQSVETAVGWQPINRLEYILRGRTREQVEYLERTFDALFAPADVQPPEDDDTPRWLRHRLNTLLSPQQAAIARGLLEGFDPAVEGERIHSILFPFLADGVIPDPWSDPGQYSVSPQHVNPRYLRKFFKRRTLRWSAAVPDRVSLNREILEEIFAAFSAEQRAELDGYLHRVYGYRIPEGSLWSLSAWDPRKSAARIHEILTRLHTPREVAAALSGLSPEQCTELRIAFESCFGIALDRAVKDDLNLQFSGDPGQEWSSLFDVRLSGVWREPLDSDLLLLALDSNPEAHSSPWLPGIVPLEQFEDYAVQVAGDLMNEALSPDERGAHAASFLRTLPLRSRNGLERTFFQLSDPERPLRQFLTERLSTESSREVEALLLGLDAWLTDGPIAPTAGSLFALHRAPLEIVHYLINLRLDGEAIEQRAEKLITEQEGNELLLEGLSVLYTPLAENLFQRVISLARRDVEEITNLKEFLNLGAPHVFALERAYDARFGRLRVHLKLIATQEFLTDSDFAHLILTLEGLSPGIPNQIKKLLELQRAEDMFDLLEEHALDQPTIEECYNAFFPEETLRRAILGMSLPEDITHELILHLDGYYPRRVAQEIDVLMSSYEGAALGKELLDLLATPTAEKPNRRIPSDMNWIEEMTHQIRRAYESSHEGFIAALRARHVPEPDVWALFVRAYGANVAETVAALHIFLEPDRETNLLEKLHAAEADESLTFPVLIENLSRRGERFRYRVALAYDACFTAHGRRSLRELLTDLSGDKGHHRKLLSLFQGGAALNYVE